ncbi:MAG: cell division protein FtsX [Pseudomonadota bacterium]
MMRPPFAFLPEGRAAKGLLPWVIAVMMYLSALAAVGGLALSFAMATWSGELDRRLTVQIVTPDAAARKAQQEAAVKALAAMRGVAAARALDAEETARLLEPWLGAGNVVADLPVPALIDIELDAMAPATPATLRQALARVAPDARLDDHQRWLGEVRRLLGVVIATLAVIFLLVVLATIAIVIFGTRARLAMYDQTVEILHLIGASDGAIAREFQWRFLLQGLRGGLIGAGAALVTLLILGVVAGRLDAGLLPSLRLDLSILAVIALIPFLAGLLTMATARFTVLHALKRMV